MKTFEIRLCAYKVSDTAQLVILKREDVYVSMILNIFGGIPEFETTSTKSVFGSAIWALFVYPRVWSETTTACAQIRRADGSTDMEVLQEVSQRALPAP